MTDDEARYALMEVWTPEAFDPDVAGTMLGLLDEAIPKKLGQGLVEGRSVHTHAQVGVLSSRSATPHVDGDFSPWSALWVLRAGKGHRLSMADHVPSSLTGMGRIPPTKAHHHLDLRAGDVVLFHAHRLHWLKPADDKGMMSAVSMDFERRPERDQVEARILGIIEVYGIQPSVGLSP